MSGEVDEHETHCRQNKLVGERLQALKGVPEQCVVDTFVAYSMQMVDGVCGDWSQGFFTSGASLELK